MTAINIDRLLKAGFFTPFGMHPVLRGEVDWSARMLLWGPPGGGKTTALRRLADSIEEDDEPCARFIFDSTMGDGGLGVIPVPDVDKEVNRFFPPDFMVEQFTPRGVGLVGADDLTTFSPVIQPYVLGLLLDKRLGSHYFGPRVRIFAATNEAIDAPGGYELAPALANRPCHIDFPDGDVDGWCDYMEGGGRFATLAGDHVAPPRINAKDEEARVLAAWLPTYQGCAKAITDFSRARRDLHRVQPDATDPKSGKAWPSPRTKECAAIALASSIIHGLTANETDTFIAGYVGWAFAREWAAFRLANDIPDALGFLRGLLPFKHSQYRLDRTAALINSCVKVLGGMANGDRDSLAAPFWRFLAEVADDNLDTVARVVLEDMNDLGLVNKRYREARPLITRLRPMLEATEL